MATKFLFTSKDFERLAATDRRLELIRGEVYEMAPVTARHFQVVGEIIRRIGNWNSKAKAGVVGPEGGFTIELRPDTVRAPDVSFVAKGRITRDQARKGFPALAPDLIVEVRSPRDRWQDLVEKAEQFLAAGTRMAILVEPDQFVEVRRPDREPQHRGLEDVLDGEEVLPGFSCLVQDLFPEEY